MTSMHTYTIAPHKQRLLYAMANAESSGTFGQDNPTIAADLARHPNNAPTSLPGYNAPRPDTTVSAPAADITRSAAGFQNCDRSAAGFHTCDRFAAAPAPAAAPASDVVKCSCVGIIAQHEREKEIYRQAHAALDARLARYDAANKRAKTQNSRKYILGRKQMMVDAHVDMCILLISSGFSDGGYLTRKNIPPPEKFSSWGDMLQSTMQNVAGMFGVQSTLNSDHFLGWSDATAFVRNVVGLSPSKFANKDQDQFGIWENVKTGFGYMIGKPPATPPTSFASLDKFTGGILQNIVNGTATMLGLSGPASKFAVPARFNSLGRMYKTGPNHPYMQTNVPNSGSMHISSFAASPDSSAGLQMHDNALNLSHDNYATLSRIVQAILRNASNDAAISAIDRVTAIQILNGMHPKIPFPLAQMQNCRNIITNAAIGPVSPNLQKQLHADLGQYLADKFAVPVDLREPGTALSVAEISTVKIYLLTAAVKPVEQYICDWLMKTVQRTRIYPEDQVAAIIIIKASNSRILTATEIAYLDGLLIGDAFQSNAYTGPYNVVAFGEYLDMMAAQSKADMMMLHALMKSASQSPAQATEAYRIVTQLVAKTSARLADMTNSISPEFVIALSHEKATLDTMKALCDEAKNTLMRAQALAQKSVSAYLSLYSAAAERAADPAATPVAIESLNRQVASAMATAQANSAAAENAQTAYDSISYSHHINKQLNKTMHYAYEQALDVIAVLRAAVHKTEAALVAAGSSAANAAAISANANAAYDAAVQQAAMHQKLYASIQQSLNPPAPAPAPAAAFRLP